MSGSGQGGSGRIGPGDGQWLPPAFGGGAVIAGGGALLVNPIEVSPSGAIAGGSTFPLPGLPAILSFGTSGVIVGTPQIVPLQPVASQIISVVLNNQNCTIRVSFKDIQVPVSSGIATEPPVYQRIKPCFLDLYVNNTLVIGSVICMDRNLLVRDNYLGFVGDLAMLDTQGGNDPEQATLGSRYLLTYWSSLS